MAPDPKDSGGITPEQQPVTGPSIKPFLNSELDERGYAPIHHLISSAARPHLALLANVLKEAPVVLSYKTSPSAGEQTALHVALSLTNYPALQLALAAISAAASIPASSPSVDSQGSDSDSSSKHSSILLPDFPVIDLLNMADGNGTTILHAALSAPPSKHSICALGALLRLGADPMMKDATGRDPLDLAEELHASSAPAIPRMIAAAWPSVALARRNDIKLEETISDLADNLAEESIAQEKEKTGEPSEKPLELADLGPSTTRAASLHAMAMRDWRQNKPSSSTTPVGLSTTYSDAPAMSVQATVALLDSVRSKLTLAVHLDPENIEYRADLARFVREVCGDATEATSILAAAEASDPMHPKVVAVRAMLRAPNGSPAMSSSRSSVSSSSTTSSGSSRGLFSQYRLSPLITFMRPWYFDLPAMVAGLWEPSPKRARLYNLYRLLINLAMFTSITHTAFGESLTKDSHRDELVLISLMEHGTLIFLWWVLYLGGLPQWVARRSKEHHKMWRALVAAHQTQIASTSSATSASSGGSSSESRSRRRRRSRSSASASTLIRPTNAPSRARKLTEQEKTLQLGVTLTSAAFAMYASYVVLHVFSSNSWSEVDSSLGRTAVKVITSLAQAVPMAVLVYSVYDSILTTAQVRSFLVESTPVRSSSLVNRSWSLQGLDSSATFHAEERYVMFRNFVDSFHTRWSASVLAIYWTSVVLVACHYTVGIASMTRPHMYHLTAMLLNFVLGFKSRAEIAMVTESVTSYFRDAGVNIQPTGRRHLWSSSSGLARLRHTQGSPGDDSNKLQLPQALSARRFAGPTQVYMMATVALGISCVVSSDSMVSYIASLTTAVHPKHVWAAMVTVLVILLPRALWARLSSPLQDGVDLHMKNSLGGRPTNITPITGAARLN